MAVGATRTADHCRESAGCRRQYRTEIGVRAPPDGYTLLMALSVNAINATLYENLNFNFIRAAKEARATSLENYSRR